MALSFMSLTDAYNHRTSQYQGRAASAVALARGRGGERDLLASRGITRPRRSPFLPLRAVLFAAGDRNDDRAISTALYTHDGPLHRIRFLCARETM